jgi:hypothetical protein
MTTDELVQQELERKQKVFQAAKPEIEKMYLSGANLPKIEAKFPDVDRRLLRTWAAVVRTRRAQTKERLLHFMLQFIAHGRYGYYLDGAGADLVARSIEQNRDVLELLHEDLMKPEEVNHV